MMKKICVMTATRAEYGLLKNVIRQLNNDSEVELKLAVTGMHLSEKFGLTYKEIENDGFPIDVKIPILSEGDSEMDMSITMSNALRSFAEYFAEDKPDMLVVLGDRYETLAVCIAAMNARIPIAHIHGGEITEGAVDDAIRHSISKMSYLHFTSTEEYRNRVIQLGESPDRVFYVGAPGVENAMSIDFMTKEELAESIGVNLDKPYFVCTYHPVTLKDMSEVSKQVDDVIAFIKSHTEYNFIFTKANADAGGQMINDRLDEINDECEHVHVFTSLGLRRYLSALKYSKGVIGNTSSGILEAPTFKIPTINIGDRQRGRMQAQSVINCEPTLEALNEALKLATSKDFVEGLTSVTNPYEKKDTAKAIYEKIIEVVGDGNINLSKKFYDVNVRDI